MTFILLLTLLLAPVTFVPSRTATQAGWRMFKGAWFEISYPASFRVRPSLRSNSASGYDSAFFTSSDGAVEFYIFSPQWNGAPSDIEVNPYSEILISETLEDRAGKTIRRVSIRARDGSYQRAFEDLEDRSTNTRRVFGISYRDQASYDRYRQAYLAFKRSLQQFAD